MRKTLSFLKRYKIHIIIAYILTILELIIDLALPILLGKMINNGVLQENINNVLFWSSIFIAFSLLSFLAGVINSFYASHTSNNFAYDIRKKLFEHIQSFTFTTLNGLATSKLVTYFTNDVRQVQTTIFMGLRIITKAPFMIIGSVIMAFVVNVKLAFIFTLIVPAVTIFVVFVLRRTANMFKVVQGKVDHINLILQENLLNMKLIKAFVRHSFERKKFNVANNDLTNTTRRTFRFVESSMPIILFAMNICTVFILWIGHSQVITEGSSVGDVVAVVNYAARIAMSISMLTFITLNISRMKASAERLSDILLIDDQENNGRTEHKTSTIRGHIEFNNVSFSYPQSNKTVLKDISFSIKENETIAILGATGSGKTTLFQLLSRLFEPSEGAISIDNKPITHYPINELRNAIGYVPQSPLLFSGSVIDNIKWGKRHATDEEIVKATTDAQIHDVIMNLPNGYETEVSQRGVNLSGGQKQRLSIARALIRKPKILLLDDCTSALDYATEAKLLKAITTYNCTTLIITQKITTAQKADKILLIDDGAILHYGTDEQLMEQSSLYVEIVESQREKELTYVT